MKIKQNLDIKKKHMSKIAIQTKNNIQYKDYISYIYFGYI